MWTYSPERVLQVAQQWWGWKPHTAQREWMLDTHPVKVAACGRRWGKTESLAVETAALALLYPGIRQVIVAPTLDQACILFERTLELLQAQADETEHKLQVRTAPYPRVRVNEGEIVARSAYRQARSLRGRNAHRIVVDEAAYLTEEVIPQVLMPMLADTEGQIVLLSTPFGRNHFWQWYQRGQAGEICRSFRFPTSSNPRISPNFLQMQRQLLTERQFAIEYEAQFVDDTGAVFPQAVIEQCIQPRLADAKLETSSAVAGLDWGRYRDYTALVVLSESGGRLHAVHVERLPSSAWQNQIEQLIRRFSAWCVRTVCCDATGIGDPLTEMLQQHISASRMGVRVRPVVLTAPAKRMVVESLALAMEQDRIAIPPHPDLLRELHAFTASRTASGHIRLQAHGSEHDDLVIALALAVHASDGDGLVTPAIRPITSGKRREAQVLQHG
ncbi:MAG: terminase family protein [Armatimonadota bacterium]|nr:terminase family protein [bacterium]MDW8320186.1 terminase family protein [Armatimonadota bacterium]